MMVLMRTMCLVLCLFSSTLWASVGKVSLLKGDAFVVRGTQKSALQTNAPLEEKDVVSTAKEAQIQLMFDDKTVVTLGSESEFKIEEYLSDATSPKAKFKFNQGSFKTITGKIGKAAPENFILETKTATIGIRGTWIRGKIDADGDTIGCLRGKIFVRSLRGGRVIEVIEGRKTFVGFDKDPTDTTLIGEGDFDDRDFRENARNKEKDAGDYDSFGYWENNGYRNLDESVNDRPLFGDISDPNALTPQSAIDTLANMGTDVLFTYNGTVAGTTSSGAISSVGNSLVLNVSFALSEVYGTMDFKSSDSPASIDYTGGNNISVNNGIIVGNGFSGDLVGNNASYMLTGSIQGSFYGQSAETTKGTFNTTTTSGTFTATR